MTTATYTLRDAGQMLVDGYTIESIERRTGYTARQIRKEARVITKSVQSSRSARNTARLPRQTS